MGFLEVALIFGGVSEQTQSNSWQSCTSLTLSKVDKDEWMDGMRWQIDLHSEQVHDT